MNPLVSGAALRPHNRLFREGLIAVLAFMTPVFVVLYSLTIPRGPWMAVVIAQIAAIVVIVAAAIGGLRARVWVGPAGIAERGFFGRTTYFPTSDIARIYSVRVYQSGTAGVPQLFVCAPDGRSLVRMRGQFWSQESMDAVVASLDVPYEPDEEPVTTAELRRSTPRLLYWFERHPVRGAFAIAGLAAIMATIVFVLVTLVMGPAG